MMALISKLWRKYKRGARYVARMIFLGPLLTGFAVAFFLCAVPQAREVYLGIIEDQQFGKGLLGLSLLSLLSLLLLTWQNMLATHAIDRMYPVHADLHFDRLLGRVRTACNALSASLPLLGLTFGLWLLADEASDTTVKLDAALASLGREAFQGQLLHIRWWAIGCIVFTLALLSVVGWIARSRKLRLVPPRHSLGDVVLYIGLAVAVLTMAGPLLVQPYVVSAAQFLGPLAVISLVLITLVCVMILLSILSNLFRLPVFGTVVVAVMAYLASQIYAVMTPDRVVAPLSAVKAAEQKFDPSAEAPKSDLARKFASWLAAREERSGAGTSARPYPVFIVSAQGGGNYAASMTSMFLGGLQDQCAEFAQHVFAISGVSGGAVGAAVFAANQPATEPKPQPCNGDGVPASDTTASKTGSTANIIAVALKDHLSPALALLWPDFVRRPLGRLPDLNRSSVIERSFLCAYSQSLRCPDETQQTWLGMPFDQHWDPARTRPALVLNSTWVETGFRAAFAPFPLRNLGDGTLYSFYKPPTSEMNTERGDFLDDDKTDLLPDLSGTSVIQAAFVSARFPGLTPAWRIEQGGKRWNFVDGGYFDNSGATTALEIHREVAKEIAAQGKQDQVKVYLVMLTDALADADAAAVGSGTAFSDTVAPVTALLKVREQLANRAVTRAIKELEPNSTADERVGRTGDSKVLVVNLNQKTFRLPLGWKISRLTNGILQLMLGQPDLCNAAAQGSVVEEAREINRIVRDNSCVQSKILDLLRVPTGRS